MTIEIITDNDKETFQVEHTFSPGKITYKDPNVDALVSIHYRLNEVLIRREGEIESQEPFMLNVPTMGYYRQDGITFKTIIKTKKLQISPESIKIVYEHNIEGVITSKTLTFTLFI
ncbi:uncharacterized beta-barrel protein YwiB (DUF1934 family) [Acholeplasma morum]|jgi:uncharacterized beta-barrel protein YwiB (DUF1934 family)|uniref:DUF1934 family protein n=1 Tax=Paracholeplasma morum TaxID=264637 RepID=UPI00195DCCFC|nr:DUF1934 family protein [Paracholeplasma morum]MBM7453125.1 uncharacterized beta-barrel protein YwiB (DUF1934 family) [Paracholeplasma morum]